MSPLPDELGDTVDPEARPAAEVLARNGDVDSLAPIGSRPQITAAVRWLTTAPVPTASAAARALAESVGGAGPMR